MLKDAAELPTLATERIELRPLVATDRDDIFAIFSDRTNMRYWGRPPMRDPAEASAYIEDVNEHFRRRTMFQWGVADKTTHRVIGTATLGWPDALNRRAEVGYTLRADRQGKGLMNEAVTELIRFAFESLDFVRIEADVDPRHKASIRLLERQGFRREGYLRERWIIDGAIFDSYFYGLLRREWTEGKAAPSTSRNADVAPGEPPSATS